MNPLHMDTEQVREMAYQMARVASYLDDHILSLRRVRSRLAWNWVGEPSSDFQKRLILLVHALEELVDDLHALALRVAREAEEWEILNSDAVASRWRPLASFPSPKRDAQFGGGRAGPLPWPPAGFRPLEPVQAKQAVYPPVELPPPRLPISREGAGWAVPLLGAAGTAGLPTWLWAASSPASVPPLRLPLAPPAQDIAGKIPYAWPVPVKKLG